ncbi:hypothetical protein SK803_10520 [Lentzea sp. BCCO 10_0856]|uniref:Uncharacterized protein n=1 Tax=Lentzea miocenica TaxID=3095431 RepID=A0ABU4SXL5_9PSEU|nr:hypothetical protein [Lentzea sp. BCCO 10_0856]MDX8030646.1 hypothetical protein [Lentzea sp. BCCO 10_0856]
MGAGTTREPGRPKHGPATSVARGKPAAPHGIAQLQTTAGNAAVTSLIQRQQVPQAEAALTPDQRKQLLAAATTLRRVPALSAADDALLGKAMGGAPLYDKIGERDRKRAQLAELNRQRMTLTPVAGVPDPQSDEGRRLARVITDIATAEGELRALDTEVREGLRPLGLTSEAQLVDLVTVQFPRRFLERGKQIILTELQQNRELAERERDRYAGGQPDQNALRAAARDLRTRRDELAGLEQQLQQARSGTEALPGGVREPAQMTSSDHDVQRIGRVIGERSADLSRQRDQYRVRFPILDQLPDPAVVADADDARLAQLTSGPAGQVIADIDTTKRNVESGRLKVWNLRDAVDMTVLDLGIGGNDVLMRSVREHIEQERGEETLVRIATSALALTAAIIATVASGGVALLAGGLALAAGATQAVQSYQTYAAEVAAGNIALDPRVADISLNEPDLFWLVVDIVFVVADAAQVLRIFSEMRLVAHALRDTGDLGEFARAARAALPAAAADKVIARAARYASSLPARGGGRAGIAESLEWLTVTNPLTGRPFSQARFAQEIEAVRRALLATEDIGRVHAELRRLGITIDRATVASIKRYNFDSAGIAMSYRNYVAWRRLASGQGQVRDAQYIVHEAAEVGHLRTNRSRTGFDHMGAGFENMSRGEQARWTADFDRAYMAAHRQALEAEYDFLAATVSRMTNGRVRMSRSLAAVADRARSEARDLMMIDGVVLKEHRDFARWEREAAATVELGTALRERLRLGPNPTISDLVGAVRTARQ